MSIPTNFIQRGISLFPYQEAFMTTWIDMEERPRRACLYYRTGAGKTLTALGAFMLSSVKTADTFIGKDVEALVIAPPSTHASWQAVADICEVKVELISHAKFRQKDYLVPRSMSIIVDEFHLLGGAKGQGFKKIKQIARTGQGDIIICSATPNYNDAERCYCVLSVIDPPRVHGGFLQFLMSNCITRVNPFSATPLVDGFIHYKNAEEFLSTHSRVHFVPDIHSVEIQDIELASHVDEAFEKFGLVTNRAWSPVSRETYISSSSMQTRHLQRRMNVFDEHGLRPEVIEQLEMLIQNAPSKVLIYSTSAVILAEVQKFFISQKALFSLISGSSSTKQKEGELSRFLFDDDVYFLLGTAAMATGTDGIDKVADTLIIMDDTPDDSARKQLIGRILPRGADSDASKKQVYRFVFV